MIRPVLTEIQSLVVTSERPQVAVSGLEMAQNSARRAWSRGTVDERLHAIMQAIHDTCRSTAEEYGVAGNYMHGANIAGFTKVADAMLDQGVV